MIASKLLQASEVARHRCFVDVCLCGSIVNECPCVVKSRSFMSGYCASICDNEFCHMRRKEEIRAMLLNDNTIHIVERESMALDHEIERLASRHSRSNCGSISDRRCSRKGGP